MLNQYRTTLECEFSHTELANCADFRTSFDQPASLIHRRGFATQLNLRSGHAGLGGSAPKPPEYFGNDERETLCFFWPEISPPEAYNINHRRKVSLNASRQALPRGGARRATTRVEVRRQALNQVNARLIARPAADSDKAKGRPWAPPASNTADCVTRRGWG